MLRASLRSMFGSRVSYWHNPTGHPALLEQARPARHVQGRLSNLFPSTIADRVNTHPVLPVSPSDQLERRQGFEQSGPGLSLARLPGKPRRCVGGYVYVSLISWTPVRLKGQRLLDLSFYYQSPSQPPESWRFGFFVYTTTSLSGSYSMRTNFFFFFLGLFIVNIFVGFILSQRCNHIDHIRLEREDLIEI